MSNTPRHEITPPAHELPTKLVPSDRLAVNAEELGRMIGLSVRTIRTMDAAARLPRPIKLNGHSVRWLASDIENWLRAGAPDRHTWEGLKHARDGKSAR